MYEEMIKKIDGRAFQTNLLKQDGNFFADFSVAFVKAVLTRLNKRILKIS